MFKSTNPLLTRMDGNNFEGVLDSAPMTVNGTITKAFALILIATVSGAAVFYEAFMGYADKVMLIMTIALVAGLITGLVTSFMPKLAKFLAPVYAFCEGALLTGVSLMLEAKFPGIAVQAIGGTMLAFAVMLLLYRTGAIRATEKFRATILSAILTVMILYIISFIGSFFNFSIPFITGNGPMSIVFSGIVVLIASFSLILDFDFIEKGQANLLPKDFEWYGAFGLIVTLVWLYIEILNLLAKLRND